ncbi:MAG: PCRF domain-containing protein [Phycisphaerae bacterium]|nr:PCRF domain-containing protein [Phycisphaerae bacterium]
MMTLAQEAVGKIVAKLGEFEREYGDVCGKLEDPAVVTDHKAVRQLSIRKAGLEPLVGAFRAYNAAAAEVKEFEAARNGGDAELAAMAASELPAARARVEALLGEVTSRLVTADDGKVGSVMMEIRAGTGGDEAALWARDLLEMYQKYAARRGWNWEVLELTPEPGVGGVRSATVNVRGEGVWTELNFEAGVHSVKRVPATEAQGRIHTSTASVATLPEPEDVDVKIDWANEVEEFATRAQGPGGQNVNKVETAWQVHHKPTGIIIKMMEAKSQQQNRERARRLLMAKLYEAERARHAAERTAARNSQIGTGGRSEKIRTYRFKDGIVADERLPGEYGVREVMNGELDRMMKDLIAHETARRVAAL